MPQFDKQSSLYRLVVYMKPDGKQCQVFYSFSGDDKKDKSTSGNKMVRRLLFQPKYLKGRYTTALLYDNVTGSMLRKWVNGIEEDINKPKPVQTFSTPQSKVVVTGFR